jgi:hypothetical protein
MKIIPQGVGYSQVPKSGPHAIFVQLAADDFFNASSHVIQPNIIANPDAYPQNKPSSSGGAAADQSGYLGALTSFDLSQPMQALGMTSVQSVYIDNSQGAGVVVLRNKQLGLTVTAAPFTQGHYPLILPKGSIFNFDVAYIDVQADNLASLPSFGIYPDSTSVKSGGGGIFYGLTVESGFLRLQFMDIIVPPSVWKTRNWDIGTWYNFPTTITVGGTYQTLWTQNPFRKGFLVGNALSAVEPLYLQLHQFGETDAINESIGLAPGQFYQDKGPSCYTGEVTVMANTTGHVVIAKEFQ